MLTKAEWRRRKRRAKLIRLGVLAGLSLIVLILAFFGIRKLVLSIFYTEGVISETEQGKKITESLLTKNEYSRPGIEMKEVKGIVLHYTKATVVSAEDSRNYYEQLQYTKGKPESPHFIIGFEGEILQCIPATEVAFASKDRNLDTIAIEFSHLEADGQFKEEIYQSLVDLVVTLCKEYDLTVNEVIRHYDVNQKNCPQYFVEKEEAWATFKADVGKLLE